MNRARRIMVALLALVAPASVVAAQEPEAPAASASLADLDIEQLAGIRITSASRREEPIAEAATAVFVITGEDIRRAGATSIPEALRLAPGLQVARLTARDWSVTARGFAEQSPNKLLVLVDGRAVYSPLFAGVFWDAQVVPMEDVERIEVILGPGATLWGSNAVNGVINVTTRAAGDTRGGLVALRAGTAEPVGATARYGVSLGRRVGARVYGTYFDRDPSRLTDGAEGEDGWAFGQGGFRVDAAPEERTTLTLQGDLYDGSGDQTARLVTPDPPFAQLVLGRRMVRGGNVLGRLTRRFGEAADLQVQAYYDRAVRDQPPTTGRVTVDIGDVEVKLHRGFASRHDLVAGIGVRTVSDELEPTFGTQLLPARRTTHLLTAFAQGQIEVVPERWTMTVGAKVEENGLSGLEVQPNLRLRWTPASHHTVWGAVSRAVRVPTRLDTDVLFVTQVIPGSPSTLVRVEGNEAFESEELVAGEIGYRGEVAQTLSLDISAYYSSYDRLRSITPLAPTAEGGFAIVPITIDNRAQGHAYGGTLAATWRPRAGFLLRGSYTLLEMEVALVEGAPAGAVANVNAGFNPRHQAAVTGYVALPHALELHLAGRYVGELPDPRVPGYIEADARLGWRIREELSLAVVGRDLLSRRHPEFTSLPLREIPRRAEVQLEWRF